MGNKGNAMPSSLSSFGIGSSIFHSHTWRWVGWAALVVSVLIALIPVLGTTFASDDATIAVNTRQQVIPEFDEFEAQKKSAESAELPAQF